MNLRLGVFLFFLLISQGAQAAECVILLHGLARSSASMRRIETTLDEAGYEVVNQDYPSREASISALSEDAIGKALDDCDEGAGINFVTHSMGGILVRDYYARHSTAPRPAHVVMLAPPNQGSDIVDNESYAWFWDEGMGPALDDLGMDEEALVQGLPGVDYPTGIIAGNASINPFFSLAIPGPDDGTVSVASTHVEGEADWILLPVTHTFLMDNPAVISQVLSFLQNGNFSH